MGTTYGQIPNTYTNNLVFNLEAGLPSSYIGSGTVWTDISPSNIIGTILGSPLYGNGAFVFDGVDDNVTFPNQTLTDPLTLTSNFTIEHVFKPHGYQPGAYYGLTNMLFAKGNASTYNYALQPSSDTTFSFIKRSDTEGLQYSTFTVPSMLNNLCVVTIVVGTTSLECFFNGYSVGTLNLIGDPIEGQASDSIGISRLDVADASKFIGELYSVKIWNEALIPKKVFQNYYYATRNYR